MQRKYCDEPRVRLSRLKIMEGKWAMTGSPIVLVNESSTAHCLPGKDKGHDVQARNRTHSDMVNFRYADGY